MKIAPATFFAARHLAPGETYSQSTYALTHVALVLVAAPDDRPPSGLAVPHAASTTTTATRPTALHCLFLLVRNL
jgi:hypothetical protein